MFVIDVCIYVSAVNDQIIVIGYALHTGVMCLGDKSPQNYHVFTLLYQKCFLVILCFTELKQRRDFLAA